MTVQPCRALTVLSDSSEAHMAIWRLRAALPECVVTISGREVQIAIVGGERGLGEVDRALKRIPDVRDHFAW